MALQVCVRVCARVLVPPNRYIHIYTYMYTYVSIQRHTYMAHLATPKSGQQPDFNHAWPDDSRGGWVSVALLRLKLHGQRAVVVKGS